MWCWRRLLRVPWTARRSNQSILKEISPGCWRTDAEAETPVLWPPHAESRLIGKDSDAGRDWGQEEKGTPEDEMAGWHHWLDAHEFGWTPGVGDGQGGLACCDSWGRKSRTRLRDWTELNRRQGTTDSRDSAPICPLGLHRAGETAPFTYHRLLSDFRLLVQPTSPLAPQLFFFF